MTSTSLASGPAIERLGRFHRAEPGDENVAAALREHAGEFFVAFGLALQGLREAAVATSLVPQPSSMLARLAALPLLSRAPMSAWGIDLGGYALKALKLGKNASGKITVEDCRHIVLRKPLAHPEAQSERLGILGDALAQLASRTSLKRSRIVAGLPGQRVLGRFFSLPPLPEKKMAAAVQYEARRQFPLDLDDLCWDWQELDKKGDEPRQPSSRRIVVLAARRAHVEQRLSLFQSAGIAVDVVQSDCLASHNALRFELAGQAPPDEWIALADIGSDETNFVVTAPRAVWFRTFAPGGYAFTAALAQQFGLTYDQAERLKRQPELARHEPGFRAAIEPLLVQLAGEIDRSLAGYRRQASVPEVQRLYALGGGAHLHGLLRHLRQR